MTEVLVGDLVCQHTAQLIVIGSPQQTHGDVKFAIPSIRCVNFVLVYDPYANLIWTTGMIHSLQQRRHDSTEPIRIARVDSS